MNSHDGAKDGKKRPNIGSSTESPDIAVPLAKADRASSLAGIGLPFAGGELAGYGTDGMNLNINGPITNDGTVTVQ
jgi:hypothetical protein